jgi:hypothetical protein
LGGGGYNIEGGGRRRKEEKKKKGRKMERNIKKGMKTCRQWEELRAQSSIAIAMGFGAFFRAS